MTTSGDVESAARLVSFGMRPKQLPSRDVVYGDLVRRYGEDSAFKQLTHAVAAGLGLMVLEVNLQAGAVLAATDESVFEIKMDSYARQSKIRERRETEKVLHGLVHLATAALGYPRPDDLANDTYIGRVSVEQVDAMVREACRILDERAAQAEANNDPLADAPELEQAWRPTPGVRRRRRPRTAGWRRTPPAAWSRAPCASSRIRVFSSRSAGNRAGPTAPHRAIRCRCANSPPTRPSTICSS